MLHDGRRGVNWGPAESLQVFQKQKTAAQHKQVFLDSSLLTQKTFSCNYSLWRVRQRGTHSYYKIQNQSYWQVLTVCSRKHQNTHVTFVVFLLLGSIPFPLFLTKLFPTSFLNDNMGTERSLVSMLIYKFSPFHAPSVLHFLSSVVAVELQYINIKLRLENFKTIASIGSFPLVSVFLVCVCWHVVIKLNEWKHFRLSLSRMLRPPARTSGWGLETEL